MPFRMFEIDAFIFDFLKVISIQRSPMFLHQALRAHDGVGLYTQETLTKLPGCTPDPFVVKIAG